MNKQLFTFFTNLLLVLLTSLISYANEIEIQHADLLELEKKEIKVKGKVKIKYKDITIEAPEGVLKKETNENYESAAFIGRAKLNSNDRFLEADKIIIMLNKNLIIAEGNTISKLKDKDNNLIKINCDYQELYWDGKDASARGNLVVFYKDTKINSDKAKVVFKNNKPTQAIFNSEKMNVKVEQTTNSTTAMEFILDISTHDLWAFGDVKSTIWPNTMIERTRQDPIYLTTDDLYIDNSTGRVIAKGRGKQVLITYQETKGESDEAILLRKENTGKPEKITFTGNANVNQIDKQISSHEVVFNFDDKKLTSNTIVNKRPKTIIFKNEKQF